jgi:sec-independent protein translocase protein TatB
VAIKTVTSLLKKGRKLAGEFQTHVDDMVREADLGDARDQLRQLRSFNVRGQIAKALDEDGSIRRTLDQKPFAPAGPRSAPSDSAPVMTEMPPATLPVQDVTARPMHGFTASGSSYSSWQAGGSEPDEEDAALVAADPGPSIVPPRVATRLRAERARPSPPAFVPPRSPHPDAFRPPRSAPANAVGASSPELPYRYGAGLS